MIKFRNHIGTIGISTGYLRQLISDTAESCFGVAGLNAYGAKQGVSAMLKKENTTKGVIIRQDGDELIVDLHITVNYGINVGAIVVSATTAARCWTCGKWKYPKRPPKTPPAFLCVIPLPMERFTNMTRSRSK